MQKIKTHVSYLIPFPRRSCLLWDNVEKFGGERGATHDVTIWCIRVVCLRNKDYTRAHARTRPWTRSPSPPNTHARARASMLRSTYIASLVFLLKESRRNSWTHQIWRQRNRGYCTETVAKICIRTFFGPPGCRWCETEVHCGELQGRHHEFISFLLHFEL